MNKPVRVILLDEADFEYKRLNEIVGQQIEEGKESTEEMQLLRSFIQSKAIKLRLFVSFLILLTIRIMIRSLDIKRNNMPLENKEKLKYRNF